MYCPACGFQNKDEAKFCFQCGKELSPPDEKRPSKKEWSPEPITIGIGIVMIITMYTLPWLQVRTILSTQYVTMARYVELCNNPLVSCQGSGIPITFYLLWMTGIFFILAGLFAKKAK